MFAQFDCTKLVCQNAILECRQSEKSLEIFAVMNISISRSAQFLFPKNIHLSLSLTVTPSIFGSISSIAMVHKFDKFDN